MRFELGHEWMGYDSAQIFVSGGTERCTAMCEDIICKICSQSPED